MNKKRWKQLNIALRNILEARQDIEGLLEEEQAAIDALHDYFPDKAEVMQDFVYLLQESLNEFDHGLEELRDAEGIELDTW